MFRNCVFTVLMLLPFALSAQDSRYHLIISNTAENIDIDRQSISRSENVVQAWVRYRMKMQYPAYYSKMLNRVDCEKGELRVIRGILLDASSDTVLQRMEIDPDEQVVSTVVAGKIRDFLCTTTPS